MKKLLILFIIPASAFTCSKNETLQTEVLSYAYAGENCNNVVYNQDFEKETTDWVSEGNRVRRSDGQGFDSSMKRMNGDFYLLQNTFDRSHPFTFKSNKPITLTTGEKMVYGEFFYEAGFGGYLYETVNIKLLLVNAVDTIVVAESLAKISGHNVVKVKNKINRNPYFGPVKVGTFYPMMLATTPSLSAILSVDDIKIETFCNY